MVLHSYLYFVYGSADVALQRKVKFPSEFDVLDLCTDELKEKLRPVNTRLKEIQKDRRERAKVRKRTKNCDIK